MYAPDHPEYAEEIAHLKRTLDLIESKLDRWTKLSPAGFDSNNGEAVVEFIHRRMAELSEARYAAYFGRVDFIQDGKQEPMRLYVGRSGVGDARSSEPLVIDWRAPAAQLFYNKMVNPAHYYAPSGCVDGRVTLRRRFEINHKELQTIMDELDVRAADASVLTVIDPDTYLREVLSRSKGTQMGEIVATIQEQQDAIIRAPYDQSLLIQGVAGSGKSVVVLHRIAYLLYPGNAPGLDGSRILIIGPNQFFLRYISHVVPTLTDALPKQTTFYDWALANMGMSDRKVVWEDAGDAGNQFDTEQLDITSALVKANSIATVLERMVEHNRQSLNIPEAGLRIQIRLPQVVELKLSAAEIREAFEQSEHDRLPDGTPIKRPLLVQKRDVATRLQHVLLNRYVNFARKRGDFVGPVAGREIKAQLAVALNTIWPSLEFPAGYFELLSNLIKLGTFGKDVLSVKEQFALCRATGLARDEIARQDVAPLYYFYLLMESIPEQYHHIVVDEVQDLTPLQLKILDMHASRAVMTLAGDTSQSLTSNGNIESWQDVFNALPNRQFETKPLSVSYRSTAEIVALGNKVLAHLSSGKTGLATPFDRHGPEPVLIQAKSEKETVGQVVHIVKKALERSFQTVAVICKMNPNAARCRTL
jgi:DNA helicase-2/ATP-dependent DNA helicase PcrA